MMTKAYTLRMDSDIMERTQSFCNEHGIKFGFFVGKALEERLQDISDIEEFGRLQPEIKEAVDLEKFLTEIGM